MSIQNSKNKTTCHTERDENGEQNCLPVCGDSHDDDRAEVLVTGQKGTSRSQEHKDAASVSFATFMCPHIYGSPGRNTSTIDHGHFARG